MNIFKTFDIFLREPLSLFRDKIIQIVGINSGGSKRASVSAEFLDKKTQITVYNSDKMYNLLRTVLYKKELQKNNQLQKNQNVLVGQLLKRY
ncbi:MAG TPA: hypothetical protein PLG15_00640 [Candidatus Gastranaerophilaceae bacterium]|nr:hypothetical protein [Candidatus Gastranaerophilaceae bacterium]HPT40874.1 hypothetical protein [Candidatus Gastranaerophilaceae bacterium]